MKLRLTLVACPPAQGADTQRHLAGGKLTLGRGPDNDWVMRDQERVLSKNHCVVEFKSGVYLVIDSSTNGVFHNESLEPIGRGNSVVLADGDRLRFGAFVVKAQFVADDPPPEGADPFLAVLRATEERGSPPPAVDDDDPFASSPRLRSPVAFTAIPERDDEDDFLLPPRPQLDPAAAEAAWRRENPVWGPAADRDDSRVEQQAWSQPSLAAPAIPDDWEEDFLTAPAAAPGVSPATAPPPPVAAMAIPDDWEGDLAAAPAFPPASAPFSVDDDSSLARLARQADAAAQALDAVLPYADDAEGRVSLHMRALLAAARRVLADAGLPIEHLEAAYRQALDEGTTL